MHDCSRRRHDATSNAACYSMIEKQREAGWLLESDLRCGGTGKDGHAACSQTIEGHGSKRRSLQRHVGGVRSSRRVEKHKRGEN
jgi:hypothetical protein